MALNPKLMSLVSKSKAKYTSNNGNTVKPKDGRNQYRILAPVADWVPPTGQFWSDLGVHWIKADENGKPLVVLGDCETVYDQPSKIVTAIRAAMEVAPDEDTKKLYKSWLPKKSVLVNAIQRDLGTGADTMVVLELTATTWNKFLELFELHGQAGQDITDPNEGVDIVVTRSGAGLNTEYSIAAAPGMSKKVTPDQLQAATDLPKFIEQNYFRGEEQKALNAISQIAGIAVPALGGPGTSTPTAALTSSAASVAEPIGQAQAETAQEAAQYQSTQQEPVDHSQSMMTQQAQSTTASGLTAAEENALMAELEQLTS